MEKHKENKGKNESCIDGVCIYEGVCIKYADIVKRVLLSQAVVIELKQGTQVIFERPTEPDKIEEMCAAGLAAVNKSGELVL